MRRKLYLIPSNVTPSTKSQLDFLSSEQYKVKNATAPNSNVEIPTFGLEPDEYWIVAVDAAGNVSRPSSKITLVEGPAEWGISLKSDAQFSIDKSLTDLRFLLSSMPPEGESDYNFLDINSLIEITNGLEILRVGNYVEGQYCFDVIDMVGRHVANVVISMTGDAVDWMDGSTSQGIVISPKDDLHGDVYLNFSLWSGSEEFVEHLPVTFTN